MHLVLAYFDTFIGPEIFFTVPDPLSELVAAPVKRLLDTSFNSQIYEYVLTEEHVKVVHFPFQIPSKWSRGKAEMLLLAVVLEKDIRSDIFYPILHEIADKITQMPDIYKGLYKVSRWREPEVHTQTEILEAFLKDSYKNVETALEQSAIGHILFLGLNNVGKTSIIEWLRGQAFTLDIKPTLAVSVIELLLEKYRIKTIDVSGQKSLRKTWWTFTQLPDAIVFVVDVTEPPERLKETKSEFEKIMTHFASDAPQVLRPRTPVLICGNKIDLTEKSSTEIIAKLLTPEIYKLNHKIQLTSAKTGEGVVDGFKWVMQELLKIA